MFCIDSDALLGSHLGWKPPRRSQMVDVPSLEVPKAAGGTLGSLSW